MSVFLRLLLFGTCAAVGTAIAIGVATNQQLPETLDEPSVHALEVAMPDAAPLWNANEPARAQFGPPVGQQSGAPEDALRRVEEISQQSNSAVVDALKQVTELLGDQSQRGDLPLPPVQAPVNEGEAPVAQVAEAALEDTEVLTEIIEEEGDGGLTLNLANAEVKDVLDMLARHGNMNLLTSRSVTGTVTASLTSVDVQRAFDAILTSSNLVSWRNGEFVYVGTVDEIAAMENAGDELVTRVYRLSYAKAIELQTLVTPLLTQGIGSISVSGAAQVGIASDQDGAGGDDFAGEEVVLVHDYQSVLQRIDAVVDEVDRRPLQVQIEAMIVDVSLDDDNEFGVDFELLRSRADLRLTSGDPLSSLSVNFTSGDGVRFGYLGGDVSTFLTALETFGETHVVSSPSLLCLNKQKSEIHIGEQTGYVSTTVTENAATQSIEFLETGTQLRLRPYIAPDGMIRLEIHPELSTGTVTVTEGFTLPEKDVTQVTTNVMVRDGTTVVIGGLIREDLAKTGAQIPVLGSLPILGPIFRQTTDTIRRSEIIVLVTPHIVSDHETAHQGADAVVQIGERHAVYSDKMTPLSKTFYSRQYFRMARTSWADGNARDALRYTNLSIHFNPINQEAINLRRVIVSNSNVGDQTIASRLRVGLGPFDKPPHGGRLPIWMLDQIDPSQVGTPVEVLYEPGDPARRIDIDPQP